MRTKDLKALAESSLDDIAQIVIGTALCEPDSGLQNEKQAWEFFQTEIQKHDNEVAVAVRRNDGACFGTILINYTAPETFSPFKGLLQGMGFYDTEDA